MTETMKTEHGLTFKKCNFLLHGIFPPSNIQLMVDARLDCLPQPVRTTQSEIVKIYTIVLIDFLLLVFECYALRLRPVICGYFYRKVSACRCLLSHFTLTGREVR